MKRPLLALAFLSVAAGAAHAESALTLRATEVQAEAQSDSATLATLPENARVEILTRKGAWSQVRTANGQHGWVRILNLKPESGSTQQVAPGPDGPVGALNKLLSSGRTSNTATVTTAVRGLPREEQDQRRDPDELKRAQEFEHDKAGTR